MTGIVHHGENHRSREYRRQSRPAREISWIRGLSPGQRPVDQRSDQEDAGHRHVGIMRDEEEEDAHTHERALESGVKLHGCTVHFVTPELDHGPIIIQAAVPLLPNDDAQTLAARVLQQEHVIYPQAMRWLIEGKVSLGADLRVKCGGTTDASSALISPKEIG